MVNQTITNGESNVIIASKGVILMDLRREAIKKWIDSVSDENLREIEKIIFNMIPQDDEPLTEEEVEAIENGKKEFENGELVGWEEALRELDL